MVAATTAATTPVLKILRGVQVAAELLETGSGAAALGSLSVTSVSADFSWLVFKFTEGSDIVVYKDGVQLAASSVASPADLSGTWRFQLFGFKFFAGTASEQYADDIVFSETYPEPPTDPVGPPTGTLTLMGVGK